ncbi:MAG: metallophosphoesterase family protein [Actinomycetota bacterium]|nr:metallophosphoesterase family protein [Actinomycetota bacterium]
MSEASASDPDGDGTSPRSTRAWCLAGWVALGLVATALAVAGMVGGWRLAGPVESETELGRVSFEVAADSSFGQVDAYVPIADWGIRANAFDAPFELDVEIRSLDRRGALEAAGGAREAIEATREDLEGSAQSAVIRGFAWGLGATLAVAFVLWLLRSRSRRFGFAAAWVAGTGLAGTAACLLLASLTFDARAFSSPSYYGRGPELAQLLAFFERQQDNDRYTSTFENALSNFSAYLAEPPRIGEGEDRAIFFGSDLHSNFAILSALTTFVGDQPFILAGDFGTAGTEAEARLVSPRLTALSDQVVAVSGNHDSDVLMETLAENGISVLGTDGQLGADGVYEDEGFLSVDGLEIAAFSDPLEWSGPDPGSAERVFSFPELEDGEELEAEAKAELVGWFNALPSEPDIVLVHQNALAQHLAASLTDDGYAQPLTIVTGHNHIQQIDRYASGQVNVVNAGTLGAGGPLRVGQESAGLGELHFGETDAALQSVDLIRIEPLSGQAQAERVILDVACPPEDAAEEPCHYEPG